MLDVTTETVLKRAKKEYDLIKVPDVPGSPCWYTTYMEGVKAQKDDEDRRLASYQACTGGIDAETVQTYLAELDVKKLKAQVTGSFYNGQVMAAMACITSSMLAEKEGDEFSHMDRIRTFLSGMRLFGSESVSGFALRGDLGINPSEVASSLFVLKAPRSPKDFSELSHECAVAFFGTNRMRQRGVVGFAYVYGGFNCSPPFIDTITPGHKDIIGFCNTMDGAVAHAVYENIAPAKAIGDFCKEVHPKEFLDLYLQTVVTLYAARDIQFTHYDCHGDNVLVRTVNNGEMCVVPVEIGDGIVCYFKTPGRVATIIDYGMSHIYVDGKHYGHVGASAPLTYWGIIRDKYNPWHDVYKLLCFCLFGMGTQEYIKDGRGGFVMNGADYATSFVGDSRFKELAPLLRFFNTKETPETIMNNQRSTYFSIPWDESLMSVTIPDYINFIQRFYAEKHWEYPMTYELPQGMNMVGCTSSCLSINGVFRQSGLNGGVPDVKTCFEFVDAHSRLLRLSKTTKSSQQREYYEKLAVDTIEYFKTQYTKAVEQEFAANAKLIENFKKFTSDPSTASGPTVVVPMLPASYADLLNQSTLDRFKRYARDVVKFFDSEQRLELSIHGLEYIVKVMGLPLDHDLSKAVAYYRGVIASFSSDKQFLRDRIIADAKFIVPEDESEDYINFKKIIDLDENYTQYKWYIITFTSLLSLVNYDHH